MLVWYGLVFLLVERNMLYILSCYFRYKIFHDFLGEVMNGIFLPQSDQ